MTTLYNIAKMTSSTIGTGTFTLVAAVPGFLTFALAGVPDGAVVPYSAREGANTEFGTGTVGASGTTLTRSVTKSTNADALVSFSGAVEVAITPRAEDMVNKTGDTMTGALVVPNASGLKIRDTDASHTLGIVGGSNLTSDRTLTLTTGDADRVLDISAGNVTISAAGAALVDDADAAAQRATLSVRETLTATRSYYVRTDGSDSNTGLADTSGSAFLTLQKAIDTVAALDISTYDVTIYVADGTYTAGVSVVGPWVGAATVTLQGNTTTPANVIISTTSANCIEVSQGGRLSVKGFKFTTTTSGTAVQASTNGDITLNGSFEVGACAAYQILAQTGGAVSINTNYTISGGALYHWIATLGGIIRCVSRTVTLTGTPAYTMNFAYASHVSVIGCKSDTFSGSATGTRYLVEANAVVSTNGGGATYLPGNASGSTSTGGQYI